MNQAGTRRTSVYRACEETGGNEKRRKARDAWFLSLSHRHCPFNFRSDLLEVSKNMPIYEYQCRSCEHTFEVLQKFSDPPIQECPRCSAPVQRLICPPALVFKGGGWYVNEFPTPDRKKGMEAEKGGGNGSKKKTGEEAPSSPSRGSHSE